MLSILMRTGLPYGIALAFGAGLILLPHGAPAQSASTDQPAAPAATLTAPSAVAALDLGDCPDNAAGLDQGKTFACACPALADAATVYGSDVYTADSGICTAAVHAGVLQRGIAGNVILQTIASPQVFKGATRNGIKSEAWAQPADAAFQFAPAK
jgi:hypothetical protein